MKSADPSLEHLVSSALAEDIGSGDITTSLLVDPVLQGYARVIAKEPLVVAGEEPFCLVFKTLNRSIEINFLKGDGACAVQGDMVAELNGPLGVLLTGERTALNFLQRLSGIATLTRVFVDKIKPFKAVLLDTRKTTPGWRALEKTAVRLGGGSNHRLGLYDAVLIKENHIAACGGIRAAVDRARRAHNSRLTIEVEVTALHELREALDARPDMIMLDNMGAEEMAQAVTVTAGAVPLEASGNITLETVSRVAATGVDYISVGSLTHSARAVDMSMLIQPAEQPKNRSL